MKKKPSVLFVGLLFLCSSMYGQNNALPPWQELLDTTILHGRGNASSSFLRWNSLVVDCGDISKLTKGSFGEDTPVLQFKNTCTMERLSSIISPKWKTVIDYV